MTKPIKKNSTESELSEEVTFKQKGKEEAEQLPRETVPGRGNDMCKGPEA